MTFAQPARGARAACLVACLSLQACASIPDLGPRPTPRSVPAHALDLPTADWPADAWWRAYHDDQLTSLIEEALVGSPDMAQAGARLRKAEAAAQQAGAGRYPALGAQGRAVSARHSQNDALPAGVAPNGWNTFGQGTLELSSDLDLWGKTRAGLAAATSEARAAAADLAQARLTLSTAIASTYADLARVDAETDAAVMALRIRRDTEDLVSRRRAAGLETEAAVRRAAANRAGAAADLAALAEQQAVTRNRLAAFVGQPPERGIPIRPSAVALDWRFGLPEDLATDLIARRPDITAARLRVEAAAQKIKVARTGFYPSVRLSALVGVQSMGLERLTDAASTYGSLGPTVSLPIFTGGALRGAYRGAHADYDMAVAAYDATLVRALQEVADAGVTAVALNPRREKAREALTASQDAYVLTLARYRNGMTTYLDVLSAEEAAITARRGLAALDARAFAVDVALIKALGGGFRAPA